MERIGPYILVEPLGEGGMGAVYRAARVGGGPHVAVKTVRAAGSSQVPSSGDTTSWRLLAGLRREIDGLSRLDHPGVARLVEGGVDGGVPWYAMTLVEGRTLRAVARTSSASTVAPASTSRMTWWSADDAVPQDVSGVPADAGGPAMTLSDALTVVRRLCGTLAWLHGEGVVHRDLKPDNVIVRPDGWPVIVDFGVLARFAAGGRESLELSGVAGTRGYMAPEQLRGELVDARADLYAVGCILHELLTGGPPSSVGDPVAGLPHDVPDGVVALLRSLLARRPEDRLGSAEAVAAALVALGAADEPLPGPKPRPHVYRPRLAGRLDLVARLGDRPAEGGLVALVAPSGGGKTRLLVEVGRELLARGRTVLSGECADGPRKPLTGLLRPLEDVADRARQQGEAACERVFGDRGPVLAALLPSLSSLPGQPGRRPPERLDPIAARQRLVDAARGALVAAGPLVVLLDDLQWADEIVRDVVRAIGRRPRGVLVVAACRAEEIDAEIAEILASPGVERVDLGRLDERAVAAIAADMLAVPGVPADVARRLSEASDGSPFFVAELLRTAVDEGRLVRGADGRWVGADRLDDLPTSLAELVSRRLDGLPADARALADVAAVIGREVDALLLPDASSAAAELVRRHVLEETADGSLRFVHDKLREVLLAAMPADRLAEVHRYVARAIAATRDGSRDAALAAHWEAAGEPDLAREAYVSAAARAKVAYATREAIRLLRAAIALLPTPSAARFALLADVVDVMDGAAGDPVPDADRLLAEARALGSDELLLEALYRRARALVRVGRFVDGVAVSDEAALVPSTGRESVRLMLLGVRAVALHRTGRHEGLERELRDGLAAARRLGDDDAIAKLCSALAVHLDEAVRPGAGREANLEAVAIAERTGRPFSALIDRQNIATADVLAGDVASAADELARVVSLARGVGWTAVTGYALTNLCDALRQLGRFDEAIAAGEEAVDIASDRGDERLEGLARAFLGSALLEAGEVGRALGEIDRAAALGDRVRDGVLAGGSLSIRARAERLAGRPRDALATLRIADAKMGGHDSFYAALLVAERGLALKDAGEPYADELAGVRRTVEALRCGPSSELARRLAALEAV